MINTFVNQPLPVIQLFPLFSDNYHDLFDWMDPYLRVNALWTRDNIVQWSKLPPLAADVIWELILAIWHLR